MKGKPHRIALLTLLLAARALGQHTPENEPRAGELRFNAFAYKASHNSYERDEPLYEQIDVWNVWQLELDLWWKNDGGCDISVQHYWASPHGPYSFAGRLAEIPASSTASQRFTVVYIEMKQPSWGNPTYDDWPARSVYRQCIYDAIASTFDTDTIYTASAFESIDQWRWPSRPELQRRGKNFMIVLDESSVGGPFDDDFFFGATEANPPGSQPDNMVLVNVDGGCDINSVDSGPGDVSDRWLYRAYPGGACDLCREQDGNYWDNALDFGFNFVATNCVSEGHTFSNRTHSPQPLYVREDYESSALQYGTWGLPCVGVSGLIAGIERASAMVDVIISGDTYDVTAASGGPYVIDKAVVLRATPSAAATNAVLR